MLKMESIIFTHRHTPKQNKKKKEKEKNEKGKEKYKHVPAKVLGLDGESTAARLDWGIGIGPCDVPSRRKASGGVL